MDLSHHSGATSAELEHRSAARSIFGGVRRGESYASTTYCSDVDFLKSSKSDLAIRLVFNSYRGRARV
jgi:hypothetical protein